MDRGSEPQPQVLENLNKFTQKDKGLLACRLSQTGVICHKEETPSMIKADAPDSLEVDVYVK